MRIFNLVLNYLKEEMHKTFKFCCIEDNYVSLFEVGNCKWKVNIFLFILRSFQFKMRSMKEDIDNLMFFHFKNDRSFSNIPQIIFHSINLSLTCLVTFLILKIQGKNISKLKPNLVFLFSVRLYIEDFEYFQDVTPATFRSIFS